MRNIAINLRAHAHQRDIIDLASAQLGRNRSDFMLEAACEKAQNVLLDQTFFSLTETAFEQFAAFCDAPLTRNPALESLLASPNLWEKTTQKTSNKPRHKTPKTHKTAKGLIAPDSSLST